MITASDGRLNLDRALPEAPPSPIATTETATVANGGIQTAKELEQLERANIIRALQSAEWKVSGDKGAARVLGMNASTLSSRMKALKIQKPR